MKIYTHLPKTAQTQGLNPLDYKSNEQARKFVRNIVHPLTLGFFKDEFWAGPQRIWDALSAANLEWNLVSNNYGVSPSMEQSWQGKETRPPNDYKQWKFEITFVNKAGRPTTLYGNLVASGAGSVENPLERYDLTCSIN